MYPTCCCQFFRDWVEPEIEVGLEQLASSPGGAPRVVLHSRACHLPGSPLFASLEGRFALQFSVELSWQPWAAGDGEAGAQLAAAAAAPAEVAPLGTELGGSGSREAAALTASAQRHEGGAEEEEAAEQGAGGEGEITGRLSVEVWAEVVPPFHLLPRGVVEGTCNAVMGAAIKALLPLFMSRWAGWQGRWRGAAGRVQRTCCRVVWKSTMAAHTVAQLG